MEAAFDAGRVTSDGGLALLRELTRRSGVFRQFAACFTDSRDPSRIEHTVEELLTQRVLGIICGYEDLNDHDRLRDDALLALAVGKADVTGEHRKRERDRGHALAGKSTLNRLELAAPIVDGAERYKKISYDDLGIERLFVTRFLDAHEKPLTEIIIDLDATDDPVHGEQEGRHFHGFYGHYCYLPLYVFCGEYLLGAALNTADVAPREGKRARDEMCREEPERGSEAGIGAREGEHVTEGARGQGSNRSWPGGGGAGGARAPCKMRAMAPWVGDDLEDPHAAATFSAAGDALRDCAASGSRIGRGRDGVADLAQLGHQAARQVGRCASFHVAQLLPTSYPACRGQHEPTNASLAASCDRDPVAGVQQGRQDQPRRPLRGRDLQQADEVPLWV